MKLTLVTPEKRILIGQEVKEVTVPAQKGELNILPGHQPMITTLVPGVLRYKLGDGTNVAASISWGYCNISPEGINVLAETVESTAEIDRQQAMDELTVIEKRMITETLDETQWKNVNARLAHLKARLDLEAYSKH